jgi:hypothetical protein
MLQIVASLTIVFYDCNMLLVMATAYFFKYAACTINVLQLQITTVEIANDTSRSIIDVSGVMLQIVASLMIIIYHGNMLLVMATA